VRFLSQAVIKGRSIGVSRWIGEKSCCVVVEGVDRSVHSGQRKELFVENECPNVGSVSRPGIPSEGCPDISHVVLSKRGRELISRVLKFIEDETAKGTSADKFLATVKEEADPCPSEKPEQSSYERRDDWNPKGDAGAFIH
jgi:hypothetical protein